MKAAKTDSHPDFQLMKQNDIVNFFHMQMPRWLFSHKSYKSLSLEAKVAYTFLLNRFQLSRLNGWMNDNGEVFVIFTREALADEMQISYKKAIAAFKELVAAQLIWEHRLGRGNANQIYLARVELDAADTEAHSSAPFGNEGARPAKSEHLDTMAETEQKTRPAISAHSEVSDSDNKTCQNETSEPAEAAQPEVPISHPSKKDKSYKDMSENERVSQSITPCPESRIDGQDDEQQIEELLEQCELWILPYEAQRVFKSAIERLYYSDSFTIGRATLPQARVRSHLWQLNGMVLEDAYHKLRANTEQKVKNSTAYVMSTIFNAIHEAESDLLVDPFLNTITLSVKGGVGNDFDSTTAVHSGVFEGNPLHS